MLPKSHALFLNFLSVWIMGTWRVVSKVLTCENHCGFVSIVCFSLGFHEIHDFFIIVRRYWTYLVTEPLFLGIIFNIPLKICSRESSLENSGLRTQNSVCIFYLFIFSFLSNHQWIKQPPALPMPSNFLCAQPVDTKWWMYQLLPLMVTAQPSGFPVTAYQCLLERPVPSRPQGGCLEVECHTPGQWTAWFWGRIGRIISVKGPGITDQVSPRHVARGSSPKTLSVILSVSLSNWMDWQRFIAKKVWGKN